MLRFQEWPRAKKRSSAWANWITWSEAVLEMLLLVRNPGPLPFHRVSAWCSPVLDPDGQHRAHEQPPSLHRFALRSATLHRRESVHVSDAPAASHLQPT